MINQKRVAELASIWQVDIESIFLCYNVYIRLQQINPDVNKVIDEYYKKTKKPWLKIVEELEEKGLIENLKPNDPTIQLRNLIIKDKFVDQVFISPDEIFSKLYSYYPQYGYMDGKTFIANMLDKDDKEYFMKNILKNADKFEADKLLYIISEMFDVDIRTGKATQPAKVGITKFIRNLPEIIRQWEEENQTDNNYRNRLI